MIDNDGLKKKLTEINRYLDKLLTEEENIQKICEHKNFFKINQDNFSYLKTNEYNCPDCGKRWWE